MVELPTRYRIEGVIGVGRSANVWLARDTRTGRDVAVKELQIVATAIDQARHDQIVDRFETEARSLGRLIGTEGICRLIEVGVDRARIPWLISEYMPGGSLASNPGSISDASCGLLFRALAVAHGYGIVHGDISPRNILLGSDGRPVLADFGMALLEPSTADGAMTGMTPAYAAPERIHGGPATPESDVYALAASVAANRVATNRRTTRLLDRAMRTNPRRRPSARRLGDHLR